MTISDICAHLEISTIMTPSEYQSKRQSLGYTQAELAKALGISRETVSRRESGDARYPIGREAKLALLALKKRKSSPAK